MTDPHLSVVGASPLSMNPTVKRLQSAEGSDAYTSPSKRLRTDEDIRSQDIEAARTALQRRTPVCGGCIKRGLRADCDGEAECNRCAGYSTLMCTYNYCRDGLKCQAEDCTFLHPDQWNDEKESRRRMVKDRAQGLFW